MHECSSRAEGERERPHTGIARNQRQDVPPLLRSRDQANHSCSIDARHSVHSNVGSAHGADRLSVEQHRDYRRS
jgi:hypothetical protein